MAENKKLLLLDGSSLAFRSFYGLLDLNSFRNQNGLHTNALFAFHRIMARLFQDENPTHMLVAFDAGKTTFRTEFFADYKGGRQTMPSELAEQWPYFQVMLEAMGVKSYELPNYEADDIIGTYSQKAEAAGFDVVIISGDKDLTQLRT